MNKTEKLNKVWQDLTFMVKNVTLNLVTTTPNRKGNKMAVATATYKVGDTYTTQKSKVTGTIQEITSLPNGNVRVKLDVEGKPRYTTWTSK
jgi:hypothetical protein